MSIALVLATPEPGRARLVERLVERLAERLPEHQATALIPVSILELEHGRPDAELESRFLAATEELGGVPVIGGFSLGARIAARIASACAAKALIALSYPAHRRSRPELAHGWPTLAGLCVPTLLVQGTRDAYGSVSSIRSYGPMPAHVQMHWLQDGNHEWLTRPASATSQEQHLDSAAHCIVDFLARVLVSTG